MFTVRRVKKTDSFCSTCMSRHQIGVIIITMQIELVFDYTSRSHIVNKREKNGDKVILTSEVEIINYIQVRVPIRSTGRSWMSVG